MITVSGKRAGALANAAVPYSGHVLAVLIGIGMILLTVVVAITAQPRRRRAAPHRVP